MEGSYDWLRYGRTPLTMTLPLIFDLAAHSDVLTSSKVYVTKGAARKFVILRQIIKIARGARANF